ncbi:hypothetical protein V0288_15535 [Pannus brasiliensis CCIBt3594]|uniref:ATPase AAA-type core domain-containing protein n=1 Tax=Pannus brasiliensis CCIBt3594 TaxID=1427578 RepID=A0AAW9QXR4_9CHRO
MSKKQNYNDPNQLSLFANSENFAEDVSRQTSSEAITVRTESRWDTLKNEKESERGFKTSDPCKEFSELNNKGKIEDLFLPFSYEEILSRVEKNDARLVDLIVPVTEFEEPIIQVAADISTAGYLLFLYGVSGVGKSTFISSLKIQKHIPIQEIISIDASELTPQSSSNLKLQLLREEIKKKSVEFFSENNKKEEKLCIVIDYLENLKDEEESQIKAFFRDLNALLRKYAILIIWPITVRQDLEDMRKFAQDYSSTMFHRRTPFIEFTGPPIDEYPNIAKKTIMFFNAGKTCYEFQLTDNDLEDLKIQYQQKPQDKHLIRDYLKDVKTFWEKRTNYLSRISKSIPKPTEVWFIFSYPEAEGVVARFAKQTPDIINEMWNADYKSLYAYINDNNQRKADWSPKRLTLALSSRMLTTKIMYLPTNALVSCIAAYAKEAGIPITRDDFLDENQYKVPIHWFGKKKAIDTLKRTPLCLQLSNVSIPGGKRKSGTVEKGLNNARQAFQKINEDIYQHKNKISDHLFNKAVYLTLKDSLENKNFKFSCEERHPYLTTIQPDILVDTQKSLVCLEFCYTTDATPGKIAEYVLSKLNKYMKQLEHNFGINRDNL